MTTRNIPEIAIPKLKDASTYTSWAKDMERYLRLNKVWDVVLVEKKDESAQSSNDLALLLINSSITPQLRNQTSSCNTAFSLWKTLDNVITGSAQDCKNRAVCNFFDFAYRPGEKLSAYLIRYEEVLQQLMSIHYILDEQTKIHVLIRSLPEKLKEKAEMWRVANEMIGSVRKVQDLISYLKRFIEQIPDKELALFTMERGRQSMNSKAKQVRKDLKDVECFKCHEKGHYQRNCPKRAQDDKRKKQFGKLQQAKRNEAATAAAAAASAPVASKTAQPRTFLNADPEVAHLAYVGLPSVSKVLDIITIGGSSDEGGEDIIDIASTTSEETASQNGDYHDEADHEGQFVDNATVASSWSEDEYRGSQELETTSNSSCWSDSIEEIDCDGQQEQVVVVTPIVNYDWETIQEPSCTYFKNESGDSYRMARLAKDHEDYVPELWFQDTDEDADNEESDCCDGGAICLPNYSAAEFKLRKKYWDREPVESEMTRSDSPVLLEEFFEQPASPGQPSPLVKRIKIEPKDCSESDFGTKEDEEMSQLQFDMSLGDEESGSKDSCKQAIVGQDVVNVALHMDDAKVVSNKRSTTARAWRWIMDSGTTRHMTPFIFILVNYKLLVEKVPVAFGLNGTRTYGIGVGEVHTKTGIIYDVLHVPDLRENLFSIPQAAWTSRITFEGDKVEITSNGEVKLEGHRDPGGKLFIAYLQKTDVSDSDAGEEALLTLSLNEWHNRLGHINHEEIKEMARKGMVKGLDISDTNNTFKCVDCVLGKMCRVKHPLRTSHGATVSNAVVHFDTAGPISPPSVNGKSTYFVLAIEEYSSYMKIEFTDTKRNIDEDVKLMVNQIALESGRPVVMICTDQGTEYMTNSLDSWLRERGIAHTTSVSHTPQQNGFVERAIRSIKEMARTLLIESGLPEELWDEACSTACCYMNRRPEPNYRRATRYELFHGRKPNVRNMRRFGERVAVLKPKSERTVWTSKAEILHWVGFGSRTNIHRIYHAHTGRVTEECDVRFLGDVSENIDRQLESRAVDHMDDSDDETIIYRVRNHQTTFADQEQMPSTSRQPDSQETEILEDSQATILHQQSVDMDTSVDTVYDEAYTYIDDQQQLDSLFPMRNELMNPRNREQAMFTEAGKRIKNEWAYFVLNDEPLDYKEAISRDDFETWKDPMDEEMEAHHKNGTWVEVKRSSLNSRTRIIKCGWVYTTKYRPDGRIDRRKARLVAKGYSQIPNIDYKETYAPVASMNTIRALFAIAASRDWEISQFDVKTAFLYGDVEETLYMNFPEGYGKKDKVCRLVKSLYGLKQAPRQWNSKFDEFLKKFDLIQNSVDPCLYHDQKKTILLAIYVDDGLIVAKSRTLVDQLIAYLQVHFEIKTMECETYLGFMVERWRSEKTIILRQSHFIKKILDKFGMADANPASTPEPVGKYDFANSPALDEKVPFKQLIGSLLYLVTCTRPDIAHAVGTASRTSKPTEAHWALLKQILRYLKGTMNLGISFGGELGFHPDLQGYSDADYANDEVSRKSITGFVVMYANGPLAWCSERQAIIALSTTESEYIAACELGKVLIVIRQLLISIGVIDDWPTGLYVDNTNAVRLAKGQGGSIRTKYIDVREKWLNERCEEGIFDIIHIPGTSQIADMLTKALPKPKFIEDREHIMPWCENKPLEETANLAVATNRRASMSLGTLIGKVITSMLIMMMSIQLISGFVFNPAPPLDFIPTDIAMLGDTTHYDLKIQFINPCEYLFKDITVDKVVNTKLITDCQKEYEHQFVSIRRKCVGKRLSSEALMRKNQVGGNQIGLQSLVRTRRVAPAVWAVGYICLAGLMVRSTIKSEINYENIKTLSEISEPAVLKESIRSLELVRKTVHELGAQVEEMDRKITYLNSTIKEYPTVIRLVNYYMKVFNLYSEAFMETDYLFGMDNPTASPKLGAMLNSYLWDPPAVAWSTVSECLIETDNKGLNLTYKVMVPKIEPKVRIYRQDSVKYWNETEKGLYCLMVYVGPSLIMLNETNRCMLEITDATIPDKSVVGYKCLKEEGGFDYKGRVYDKTVCETDKKKVIGTIQIRHMSLEHKIYCYGHEIEINGKKYSCPATSFYVPLTDSYSVGGRSHTSLTSSGVYVDPLDVSFNKDVMKHLNGGKMVYYSTNFTELDASGRTLTKFMNKLKTGSQVKLKDFPSLLDPVESARTFINKAVDIIEEGLAIMGFIILAVVILLSLPMLHAILMGSRFFATCIGTITRKLRDLLVWKSSRRMKRRDPEAWGMVPSKDDYYD